ncbi:hypothetical protein ZWY2020_035133 [Hordeum vulgare]|nr:hypothetical protein ZWY2020_035133 [Hordeum vulgare]
MARGHGLASPGPQGLGHSPEGPEHQRRNRRGRGGGGGEGEEDGFETDGDGRISPSELAAVSRTIAPPATESAGGREATWTSASSPPSTATAAASWTPSCVMPSTSTISTATAASPTPSSARAKVVDISENSLTTR